MNAPILKKVQKLFEKNQSSSSFISHKEAILNIEKSVISLQNAKYIDIRDEQGRTELHKATIELVCKIYYIIFNILLNIIFNFFLKNINRYLFQRRCGFC